MDVRPQTVPTSPAAPWPTATLAGHVALDDPRIDRLTLAWAKARLASAGWPARVCRAGPHGGQRPADRPRRVGPRSGPARCVAAVAPDAGVVGPLDERTALVRLDGAPPWLEGVAISSEAHGGSTRRGPSSNSSPAAARPSPFPKMIPAAEPVADGLLADLLGATLVDAQDELWAAADALDRAGHPRRLSRASWTSPRPGRRLRVRSSASHAESDELLEALSREITPDHDARAWLLRSWDGPEGPIDGAGSATSPRADRRPARPRAPLPRLAPRRVDRLGPPALPTDRPRGVESLPVGWAQPTVFGLDPGRWAVPTLRGSPSEVGR